MQQSVKKKRDKRRARGLCIQCGAPAERKPDGRPKVMCAVHARNDAFRSKRRRQDPEFVAGVKLRKIQRMDGL